MNLPPRVTARRRQRKTCLVEATGSIPLRVVSKAADQTSRLLFAGLT